MFTRHLPHWPTQTSRHLAIPATSLYANLAISAQRYPDQPAIHYYGNTLTYAALQQAVDALAGYLTHRLHVQRGDRVLLDVQNSPQFVIGYYAILRADAVVVPINPMLRTDELRYLATDSGAQVALFGQETLPAWLPLLGQEIRHGLVATYSDYLPAPEQRPSVLPEEVLAAAVVLPPEAPLTHWRDALAANLAPAPHLAGPDDMAVLPYTSGTTGHPKGCSHTHYTTMSTAVGQGAWAGSANGTVVLATLPMFHVTGMQSGMNVPIYHGGAAVIMTRWQRDTAAELIERYQVTSFTGITAMLIDFMGKPDLDDYDLSSLLHLSGGGAAMPRAVAERLQARIGQSFVEGYGLTETMAPTHINPFHRPKPQCAGIPYFNTDARVIDLDTGAELPPGATGEIIVHGPQIFKGYWNRPEATADAFIEHDGKRFFRTGDLGHYDEEGYFFITDRLKRMINAAGFKVWPAEVEAMLYAHPAVAEACVVAARDAQRGETVKAFIVARPDAAIPTEEEFVAWAREQMAAYKVPRLVEFVPALPKTGTGKVFWRQLQEQESQRSAHA